MSKTIILCMCLQIQSFSQQEQMRAHTYLRERGREEFIDIQKYK